ncbi:MAG: hypothetical protein O9327_06315, partial [Polaromonas sp.]|nr:hypothetical protein [Polaromonas sp.]
MVAIGVMERALATAPMSAEKSKPLSFMFHPVANQKTIVFGLAYWKKGKNTRSTVGVSEGWPGPKDVMPSFVALDFPGWRERLCVLIRESRQQRKPRGQIETRKRAK